MGGIGRWRVFQLFHWNIGNFLDPLHEFWQIQFVEHALFQSGCSSSYTVIFRKIMINRVPHFFCIQHNKNYKKKFLWIMLSILRKTTKQAIPATRRLYHENVVEHYENPRNVGSLDKNDKNVGTSLKSKFKLKTE